MCNRGKCSRGSVAYLMVMMTNSLSVLCLLIQDCFCVPVFYNKSMTSRHLYFIIRVFTGP